MDLKKECEGVDHIPLTGRQQHSTENFKSTLQLTFRFHKIKAFQLVKEATSLSFCQLSILSFL